MTARLAVAVLLAVTGCGDNRGRLLDGGDAPVAAGCPAGFSYFGEACTVDPTMGANTPCHNEQGWCIEPQQAGAGGICHPMCSLECDQCGGSSVISGAGACYCQPQM